MKLIYHMDKERIKKLIRELIIELGEDPTREGLKDTPRRIADAYNEIFSGYGYFELNHQIKTDDQINSRLISIENTLDTQKLVQNFLLRKKYLKLINLENIN